MWQRHTTVVNKPARSTEDNGEDLSTRVGKQATDRKLGVTLDPERK